MLQNSEAFSGYSVDDIKKAKDFYGTVLGLKIKENAMGILDIHFPNGHNVIIYPKPNHEPATFTVLNFQVKNIEKSVDELSENGTKFLQYEEPIKTNEKGICDNGDHSIAWFKDPAGNILSLIQKITD